MKQEIHITMMALAVIAGLFLFQQCTETVFKKKQAEHRALSEELPLPTAVKEEQPIADRPASRPQKSEAPRTEEPEKHGIQAVNAEFKQAFETLGDHMGTQWNRIDRSAVVNDMKVQANQLSKRIDRLENRISKQYGEQQALAEVQPLRQLHGELLYQIAAAEQADARIWKVIRADQRASFRFLREDLQEELALTEQLLKGRLLEPSEPQLASGK